MSKKATSEDAFYEHLTLGLMRTLANVPRVCNVFCEKRQPCEKAQVVNWEQRHSVYLPEDMKKFYLSTDGFLLQWSYEYAPSDIRRVGYIHFPHLLQITLLRENVETNVPPATATVSTSNTVLPSTTTTVMAPTAGTSASSLPDSNSTSSSVSATTVICANEIASTNTNQTVAAPATVPVPVPPKDLWGHATPLITVKTKIFELNTINDVAKVCLVYEASGSSNPKVFLLELLTMKWVFLADTFSEYLRMAVAHLGLPFWELCFSSFGLPAWTEQLFMLLAPHLLEEHAPRCERIVNPASEHPYNNIDVSIFRTKPKGQTKSSGMSKMK